MCPYKILFSNQPLENILTDVCRDPTLGATATIRLVVRQFYIEYHSIKGNNIGAMSKPWGTLGPKAGRIML